MRIYNYGIASGAYGRADSISESEGNKSAEKSAAAKRTERTSAAGISALEKVREQWNNPAAILENLRDTVSLGGAAASPGYTPNYSRSLINLGFKMLPR
jgi:hypothetical protein